LRMRVPLFKGQLPLIGGLTDQVSEALQGMLIERKVQGQVDYMRFARDDGPVEAMVYSVSGPSIRIRHVIFDGAGQAELPALQAAGAKLEGVDYHLSAVQLRAEKDLLPVYLERGYLKASFGTPVPKVVQDSADETLVDVNFPVSLGQQYKLEAIELAGYRAFSSDELRKAMQSRLGEAANGVQLSKDIEAIKKIYETRGYMAAEIHAAPEFDDAKSQVKYVLQIQEGEVYKMGDLEIRGLDGRTTARLEEQWKIRGGDPYNGEYPPQFVRQALKQLQLMGDWKAGMHIGVNQKDKTVDVTLVFDPQ
jgi:outer membrane protein assembly factor BamA